MADAHPRQSFGQCEVLKITRNGSNDSCMKSEQKGYYSAIMIPQKIGLKTYCFNDIPVAQRKFFFADLPQIKIRSSWWLVKVIGYQTEALMET